MPGLPTGGPCPAAGGGLVVGILTVNAALSLRASVRSLPLLESSMKIKTSGNGRRPQ